MRFLSYICFFLLLLSCKDDKRTLVIAGDIEDPKNEIAKTIAELLNNNSNGTIKAELKSGMIPSLDSLVNDAYQLMIVDNNITYRPDVSAIAPLFPQILHILHRKGHKPKNFNELVSGKKLYAGSSDSGSFRITKDLIKDFHIDGSTVEFVDILNLFEADVIILFTGLMSSVEFTDLQDFEFYSLDKSKRLDSEESIVNAICLRHPEFKPYVLPRLIYGDFTPKAVITISNEAVLVCRKDLDEELVYDINQSIHQNKQMFSRISPLLFQGIKEDYDVQSLSFSLHKGARNYLERNEPSIFEKNSNLIEIFLTLLLALGSGVYSLYNYRKIKRKDKIDVYYQQLIDFRLQLSKLDDDTEIEAVLTKISSMQNETIGLIVNEKLGANDSFLVFLKLCEIVSKEANDALNRND